MRGNENKVGKEETPENRGTESGEGTDGSGEKRKEWGGETKKMGRVTGRGKEKAKTDYGMRIC